MSRFKFVQDDKNKCLWECHTERSRIVTTFSYF